MDALDIELYASLGIIGATLLIGVVFIFYFLRKISKSGGEE